MSRYWKHVDTEGNIVSVEWYSHDHNVLGASESNEDEYNGFMAALPAPVEGEGRVSQTDEIALLRADVERLKLAVDALGYVFSEAEVAVPPDEL